MGKNVLGKCGLVVLLIEGREVGNLFDQQLNSIAERGYPSWYLFPLKGSTGKRITLTFRQYKARMYKKNIDKDVILWVVASLYSLCTLCTILSSSRRPIHLSPTQNMQMQMINTLRPLLSIIHHNPKSIGTMLFSQLSRDDHQTSQNPFMAFRLFRRHGSTPNLCQSLTYFGNDQNVRRCLGCNITKGKNVIIFVDFVGGPFPGKDFIKYGIGPASSMEECWYAEASEGFGLLDFVGGRCHASVQ